MLPIVMVLLQAASPPPGAVIADDGTITVTATRLSDLAAAVAACAARPCPTRQDAAVSIAYASALFDEGRYREAKQTLGAAVSRVKRAAAKEPIAVSQVYTAQATLSAHEGDQRITERATHAGYRVLRDGLGPTALPTLSAAYRLAIWELRVGRAAIAERHLAEIADVAAAAGHAELADAAVLQRAQVLAWRKRRPAAFALLDSLAARPVASGRAPGDAAQVQRAALATAVRLATDAGDEALAGRYLARFQTIPDGDVPQLLSQTDQPRPGRGDTDDPSDPIGQDRGANAAALTGLRWADIGYWIRPDGSVDDIDVLRGSRNRAWTGPLVRWIAARRYTPSRGKAGHYRVERYSLTADYRTPIGSLIRRRAGKSRYEVMPMGEVPAAAE